VSELRHKEGVPIEVRRLGPGDEEIVRQLSLATARFDEPGAPTRERKPHTTESAREFLAVETNFQLVAFADGEPVGLLLAYELIRRHGDGKMMFIYEIGVRDDHRRIGIGGALIEALRRICRERCVSRAFLTTSETNEPAIAFYLSMGATRIGKDVVFSFDWS
jgi:ribosomal protein S18 acetylase RimI-like enzyme